VCKVEVKVLSLPERYLVKTKQVTKPIVPKAIADINSQIDTELEAFLAYKHAKEAYIKELANKWKDQIDPRVYDALMNYQVEITD
jgi:oligoribonuclease (3'-5' exoribonuclease)